MTSSFSRGRSQRYPYCHCENKTCDNGRSYPAGDIHAEFGSFLAEVEPKPEMLSALRRLIVEQAEERQAAVQKNVKRLKEQASRISLQNKELIRMRAQGLISDQEFVAEKAVLGRKQLSLEIASKNDSMSISEIQANLDRVVAPLSGLASTWERLPIAQKRRFQQYAVPVGFTAREIGTAELGLLFRVFRQFEPPNSNVVPLTVESWNQLLQEIKGFAELFDRSEDEQMAA